jgi:hypothetical protein
LNRLHTMPPDSEVRDSSVFCWVGTVSKLHLLFMLLEVELCGQS